MDSRLTWAYTVVVGVVIAATASLSLRAHSAESGAVGSEILDPKSVRERIVDWLASTAKDPISRSKWQELLQQNLVSGLAEVRVGGQATRSDNCAVHVAHEGQIFTFERPSSSFAGPICRSGHVEAATSPPSAKLTRSPVRHVRITGFELSSGPTVELYQDLKATVRIEGESLRDHVYRIRLTQRVGNKTVVTLLPKTRLQPGLNLVSATFTVGGFRPHALLPGAQTMPQADAAAYQGPLAVVADIVHGDDQQSSAVLLGNSAAILLNVSDSPGAPSSTSAQRTGRELPRMLPAGCRDPATQESGRFIVRGSEFVDRLTRTVWNRCAAGFVDAGGACNASAVLPTTDLRESRSGPLDVFEFGSPGPWRLAGVIGWRTIAAAGCGFIVNPRLLDTFFDMVWTSTTTRDGKNVLLAADGVEHARTGRLNANEFATQFYVREARPDDLVDGPRRGYELLAESLPIDPRDVVALVNGRRITAAEIHVMLGRTGEVVRSQIDPKDSSVRQALDRLVDAELAAQRAETTSRLPAQLAAQREVMVANSQQHNKDLVVLRAMVAVAMRQRLAAEPPVREPFTREAAVRKSRLLQD